MKTLSQLILCLLLLSSTAFAMYLECGGRGRADSPVRILLTGDSLMESMGPQMKREMTGYENITLIPIGKRSTGLSRPDFYNWPKVLEANLRKHRPQIVVMWVGTNDPQNIYGYTNLGEPCSQAWMQVYTQKLMEIAILCRKYGASLIFLGPPAVDEEPLDTQLKQINALMYQFCKRYRKQYRLGYINTRTILGDSRGNYIHSIRKPDGRTVNIRWRDRVHITGDGNRLVMDKLLPYMGFIIPGNPPNRRLRYHSR